MADEPDLTIPYYQNQRRARAPLQHIPDESWRAATLNTFTTLTLKRIGHLFCWIWLSGTPTVHVVYPALQDSYSEKLPRIVCPTLARRGKPATRWLRLRRASRMLPMVLVTQRHHGGWQSVAFERQTGSTASGNSSNSAGMTRQKASVRPVC